MKLSGNTRALLLALAMTAAAGHSPAFAEAAGGEPLAIKAVSATSDHGTDTLHVRFSHALQALPQGFALQSPARIALDIPGAVNDVGQAQVDLEQGNLRSVRIVETSDRSRLVLNLKTSAGWKARIEGGELLVALTGADPGTVTAPASVFAPATGEHVAGVHPLKDIDFRRGPNGAGRVVIELGHQQMAADIRQEGRKIVLEFPRASLSEGLRRRLDVSDFGTPVQTVTATQVADRVRIAIEATGAWEQSAYQSDTQFVVEVRPPAATSTGSTTPTYTGDKISLNFQNVEVRNLLQVFAESSGMNIVTSDSVSGTLTLRLQDIPWDEALDIILQSRNLGMRRTGRALWIAPRDEIAAKEKAELEARAAIQTLEALRTQSFMLNYAKAADVATQLTSATGSSRILSTRGSVMAEARTNQLFVTDIPSRLDAVQQLISKIDIPVRQVLIEARIVEASNNFDKSLGAKFGVSGLSTSRVKIGNSYDELTSSSTTTGSMVSLPSAGANGDSAGTIALSIFNSAATKALNLELSALEADGNGRTVSNPRVLTANQAKALIEQGTEFPYQQATSSGATSVSFRKAALKLEVTPQITPEGNVMLDLDVSNDSKGETTTAGVAIDTKHVKTQALVQNGGTIVIGGIFTLSETNDESRVPVLGELPAVGALFRKRDTSQKKTEMLVFITPRIVRDLDALQ